jgi:hypothetical protein
VTWPIGVGAIQRAELDSASAGAKRSRLAACGSSGVPYRDATM